MESFPKKELRKIGVKTGLKGEEWEIFQEILFGPISHGGLARKGPSDKIGSGSENSAPPTKGEPQQDADEANAKKNKKSLDKIVLLKQLNETSLTIKEKITKEFMSRYYVSIKMTEAFVKHRVSEITVSQFREVKKSAVSS